MNKMASNTPTELDSTQAVNRVEQLVCAAQQRGADLAEANISMDAGFSIAVRMGEIETVEHQRDRSADVTVYFGQAKGSASTADLSDQGLEAAVTAACEIARFTAEDPYADLAPAERMATELPDLDLCHPWELDVEQACDIALRCEQAARDHDARITNSEGASLSTHQGLRAYANSHGFSAAQLGSQHSLNCVMIAGQDDAMQRDYWYSVARDASALESAEQIGRTAAEKTVSRLNPQTLKTGEYPVLLSAPIARSFWGHLISAISGGALYRKASFLLDKLDQMVLSSCVSIKESPHLLGALGSSNFDAEGVATRDRTLVESGVLRGYVLGSYSARRLGMESTANAGGIHNLLVKAGQHDVTGLLGQMDSGFLVTEMMGSGVNTVTGDYSRGATGFWVENGQIQYPVSGVTVAGNLTSLFQKIVAVGSDVDCRGTIQTGSVLVSEMMVAGA